MSKRQQLVFYRQKPDFVERLTKQKATANQPPKSTHSLNIVPVQNQFTGIKFSAKMSRWRWTCTCTLYNSMHLYMYKSISPTHLSEYYMPDTIFSIIIYWCTSGASIYPETMMHFPPLFQIPPISKKVPPILAVSVHFPPVSQKLFFPPYFYKFPPVLGKFTCFLHTLRVFPPYFDHDAFMHHPMHVLDAPDVLN